MMFLGLERTRVMLIQLIVKRRTPCGMLATCLTCAGLYRDILHMILTQNYNTNL